MIYTVSFNPSLDYVQDLDCVNLGYVNRTSGEKILPEIGRASCRERV